RFASLILFGFALAAPAVAQTPPNEITLREGLALAPTGPGERIAIPADVVEAALAAGTWSTPKAGDTARSHRKWQPVRANKDGLFQWRALWGGYLFVSVSSDDDRLMMLDAAGHLMVYVNGEPRTGDLYSHDYVRRPIWLKKGMNEFLFHGGRGQVRAKLNEPKSAVFIDPVDPTLPDLIAGQPVDGWGAVLVVNATRDWQRGLALDVSAGGGPVRTAAPALPPLSVTKVPCRIVAKATEAADKFGLRIALDPAGGVKNLDQIDISLRVVKPGDTYKRTFRHRNARSVQ